MPIKPKKHLTDLYRVGNQEGNRSECLRLDKNENLIGFSDEVLSDLREIVTSEFLTSYPDIAPLYRALAGYTGLNPGQLYVASGSDGAIKSVFEVYVEPQDEVLLLNPTYAMFEVYAKMFQARPIGIAYEKDLKLPAGKVIEKIGPRTKLVCLANPNSPTGTVFAPDEIERIIEAASAYGALVLVDEAYYHYYGRSAANLLPAYGNLLITRTFSKALGLAAARLGYLMSNEGIVANLFKVRPMYEVNGFAVRLGLYLLERPELVARHVEDIARAKDFLEKAVSRLGLPVRRSVTNFVLVDVGGSESAVRIAEFLREEKILVKGGFPEPCLAPYIRVTVGSCDQMAVFAEKLERALQRLARTI